MSSVLTLLTDPATCGLSQAHVDSAAASLERAGAILGASNWLDPGVACDLTFAELSPQAAEAALRIAFESTPVDLAAQPEAGRRKRLLVADMESTIIGQEMLDELADLVGLRDEIAEITQRAMRGELDFEAALGARVAKLQGLPASALDEVAGRITFNPGAKALIATLKAHGARTVLVSGGFSCFSERVCRLGGFDGHHANRLVIEHDRLAGRVERPVLGRTAKLQMLQKAASDLGLSPRDACAVGDGANDLAMLRAAGLGVAYRAKPLARVTARFRLDHADLTGLLYLQGYRRDDFTELTE